jgi:mannose-6-phosphate isomerase
MSQLASSPVYAWRGLPLGLPPNRVWRTYPGGRMLDRLAGVPTPADGHFPEDWIGSVTRSAAPERAGMEEGLSTVTVGGEALRLNDLIAADPEYFLGPAHLAKFGPDPKLLVKLLDPAVRLHIQAHPSAAFAQRVLGAASGKTEAYYVLGPRPEVAEPYLYLGFQRPPNRSEMRRMVEEQDLVALEACFDPIAVRPGDTFIVPGGTPHAVGEGLLLIEIQEPSDLVARFEYSRGGYTLPPAARFMGRDIDTALDLLDFGKRSPAVIDERHRCSPEISARLGVRSHLETLIGPRHTPCFRVERLTIGEPIVHHQASFAVVIAVDGACEISAGSETIQLKPYDAFIRAAGLGPLQIRPHPTTTLLQCLPPL